VSALFLDFLVLLASHLEGRHQVVGQALQLRLLRCFKSWRCSQGICVLAIDSSALFLDFLVLLVSHLEGRHQVVGQNLQLRLLRCFKSWGCSQGCSQGMCVVAVDSVGIRVINSVGATQ
jgi:hypothetical protein